MSGLANVLLAGVFSLSASVTLAADLPTRKPPPAPMVPVLQPSPWRFEITAYGWASSLTGNSGFGTFPTLSYYAPFGKVLKHLEAALMGSVAARDGNYIVGVDTIWSRVGGSGAISVDGLPQGSLGADLKLTESVVTAFGGLRIPGGSPKFEVYGTLGARYVYGGTKLSLETPLGFGASASVNKGWVNPIVGLVGQYRFDDRWFMNIAADIGGWSSSATGQAFASVGYNWTSNISTTLGYRAMYNYEIQHTGFNYLFDEPTNFRYQQWMYGPFVGVKISL